MFSIGAVDFVVLLHASHILEKVAPHAFRASMLSIGAVDLVVFGHAGHVSEEIAPHTVRTGVGSIGAVDRLGGGLSAIVVASTILSTVLPGLTVRVGSAAVGFFDRHAGHIGEEVAPETFGARVIGTSAMGFVVLRHASHVREEVAPHTIGASVGGIRAVDLFGSGLSAIVVASAICTAVLPGLTFRVGSATISFRLGNSVEVGEGASAESHVDTSIEHTSIEVDTLSIGLEEIAPLLVNRSLLSLVVSLGGLLPAVSLEEVVDMVRDLREVWVGSRAISHRVRPVVLRVFNKAVGLSKPASLVVIIGFLEIPVEFLTLHRAILEVLLLVNVLTTESIEDTSSEVSGVTSIEWVIPFFIFMTVTMSMATLNWMRSVHTLVGSSKSEMRKHSFRISL